MHERVDVLDAVTSNVLHTEDVTAFQSGTYLAWNLTGHVELRFTNEGAPHDAELSGLFFDATPTAPPAPTNLTAAGGAGQVDLSWSDSSAVQGFQIERSTDGVNYTQFGTADPTAHSYVDTAVTAGTPYSYRVIAYSGAGASGASNTASAAPSAAVAPSALFMGQDNTTQGSWIGNYGSSGYMLADDATSLPSFVQVSMSGASPYVWSGATTDTRGLQIEATPSLRQAACWYSSTTFDINLADGQTHQVATYLLDWDDNGARSERIDILNADTGAVLDSQNASAFQNGTYLAWNLAGHVELRFTCLAGSDAVLSGLFFDSPMSASTVAYAIAPAQTLTVPVSQGVLANDARPPGKTLTASLVSNVQHGALSLNADGSFTYTPNASFQGTDSFSYNYNNGLIASNVATASIVVNPNINGIEGNPFQLDFRGTFPSNTSTVWITKIT